MHAVSSKRGLSILCIALAACSGADKSAAPPPPAKPAYSLDRPADGLIAPRARDGTFMRGVVLGPLRNEGNETAQRAAFYRVLDDAMAFGATDIELIVQWAQQSPAAIELSPQDQTIENERLEWLMDAAHARKLRVLLTPTLVVEEGAPARPNPSAEESERWWWSYRRFAIAYARIAGQHHAWGFNIGTDLPAMARDAQSLEALIRDVRKVYKGKLGYGVSATDLASAQLWPLVDFAAVGTANDVTLAQRLDDASLAKALAGEAELVRAFADGAQKELVLTDSVRSVAAPEAASLAAAEAARVPLSALRYARARFLAWQGVASLQGVFMRAFALGAEAAPLAQVRAVVRYWYASAK